MKDIITTLENLQDLDALLTAGADTILVSLEGVSSSAAQKLSLDELDQVITSVNAAGKKTAVLANLTFHEGELANVQASLTSLAEREVKTIFFADPAVYYIAKKNGFVDRLVYDPETLMTSINDASWWLERGLQGISISPLLTLEETEQIAKAAGKAVVTVHGRTLMSRSYRKLLEAYKENYQVDAKLDQNKDLYLVEFKREGQMPIYEDETGTLVYSDDVLDSFDFIEKLLASGPMALLIQGSYLSIEEQAKAVNAYRRILDGADPSAVGKEYREQFQKGQLDSGYYEQKTVK